MRRHFRGQAPVKEVITIFSKLHERNGKKILACCDEELLGKTIQTKETEFCIKESFYKGTKTGNKELEKRFEEADSVNLVGKETVSVALKNNWIKKEDIMMIDSIPHAQIFKV
jgi:hypothetical protein